MHNARGGEAPLLVSSSLRSLFEKVYHLTLVSSCCLGSPFWGRGFRPCTFVHFASWFRCSSCLLPAGVSGWPVAQSKPLFFDVSASEFFPCLSPELPSKYPASAADQEQLELDHGFFFLCITRASLCQLHPFSEDALLCLLEFVVSRRS